MRKTKLVCTIGPASFDEETLTKMCKNGMSVARLNFSHGTHEQHKQYIDLIKKVRKKLNIPLAILLDTKGPEYRIKTFKNGKVTIKDGAKFTFTGKDIEGDENGVSVSYKDLAKEIKVGDKILVNNGLVVFKAKEVTDTDVICECVAGGELSDRKSMSFPNKVLHQVYLSEQDKSDILFGIKNGVDFIACSFVSVKQDLVDVNNFLKENGGEDIDVIAKIENRSGVDNIEEICTECNGIMVARGDMGVEIPFEELPSIQKHLITTCRLLGKRVITATEMLESMIYNPRPTRAEISDVANAVYDGTSAVMLSGETAAGKYPAETVATMAKIAEEAEKHIKYKERFYKNNFAIKSISDAVSHSTCAMAMDINANCIVACTMSGITARFISRFRSPIDIIGMTTNEKAWHKLALSWGVTPVLSEKYDSTDVLTYKAVESAKKVFNLKEGDKVVVTGGRITGKSGNTSMIKVEII